MLLFDCLEKAEKALEGLGLEKAEKGRLVAACAEFLYLGGKTQDGLEDSLKGAGLEGYADMIWRALERVKDPAAKRQPKLQSRD